MLGGRRMVRLTVALTAASTRGAQELRDALSYLEPVTRIRPGCLRCANWMESDLTLQHIEEWETEADMRRRVKSEDFTMLLEMVEAAREPRVQFDFIDTTRGLDFVAEVRGQFGA